MMHRQADSFPPDSGSIGRASRARCSAATCARARSFRAAPRRSKRNRETASERERERERTDAIKSSGCQPAKTNCSHLASAYYRDTSHPTRQRPSLFPPLSPLCRASVDRTSKRRTPNEMFIYPNALTYARPFVSISTRDSSSKFS